MKPEVSVIVPCYNGERDLAQTLDALLAQTCRPAEIIVVDDGSNDNSAAIAQSYGAPVRLLRQANAGAAAARYAGVLAARCDIIVFNDAGDVSYPQRIEHLRSALIAHPHCAAAVGVTLTRRNGVVDAPPPPDAQPDVIEQPLHVYLSQHWPLAPAMNLATWRELALQRCEVSPFFRAANDYALQVRLAPLGAFVRAPQALMRYEPTPGGLSLAHGLRKQKAYALIAAHRALTEHVNARADKQLERVFADRVSDEWLELWLSLKLEGEKAMGEELWHIGWRHGRLNRVPSRLWWALDIAEEEGWLSAAPRLNWLVRKLKRLRAH